MTTGNRDDDARTFEQRNSQRRQQRQAGIVGLFTRGADDGPALLAVGKALIAGIEQSRLREAERLAGHGKEERAEALRRRAADLAGMAAVFEDGAGGIEHLVESVRQPGLFHGYVRHANGQPAAGYTVRRSLAGREDRAISVTTDSTGYFRFATEAEREGPAKGNTAAAVAVADTSHGAAQEALRVSVDVLDRRERVVFSDPAPPVPGRNGPPAFRLYPVAGGTDSDKPIKPKPGKKAA